MKITTPESDEDFQRYYDLRWQLLRKPWQQPKGSEQDELENQSYHVMCLDLDNTIIGIGRLHTISNTEAQIRYMAVTNNHQRQGIGQQLLTALENHAKQQSIHIITLHAREAAIGFYEKQAYKIIEKSHRLFSTIQHFKMQKTL